MHCDQTLTHCNHFARRVMTKSSNVSHTAMLNVQLTKVSNASQLTSSMHRDKHDWCIRTKHDQCITTKLAQCITTKLVWCVITNSFDASPPTRLTCCHQHDRLAIVTVTTCQTSYTMIVDLLIRLLHDLPTLVTCNHYSSLPPDQLLKLRPPLMATLHPSKEKDRSILQWFMWQRSKGSTKGSNSLLHSF